MAKHIHIHIGSARTKDAGAPGIKRDSDGKFATSGGSAAQHGAAAAEHRAQLTKKGFNHPDAEAHQQASLSHQNAESHLKRSHIREELGHHEVAEKHRVRAEEFAASAKKHEAKLGKTSRLAHGELGRSPTAGKDPEAIKKAQHFASVNPWAVD